MRHDEIIQEVWRNRQAIAERHDHDLHKIVKALQERQKAPLSRMVDRRRHTEACKD